MTHTLEELQSKRESLHDIIVLELSREYTRGFNFDDIQNTKYSLLVTYKVLDRDEFTASVERMLQAGRVAEVKMFKFCN